MGLLIDEGNVYQAQQKWDSSIVLYNECIAKAILAGDKYHEGIAVNNKAVSRTGQKRYQDAILLFGQSEKISLALDNKSGLLQSYIGKSQAYLYLNDIKNAYLYAKKTQALARELKSADEMMNVASILSQVFDKEGKPDSSLYYFKLSTLIKDTLNSTSRLNEISRQGHDYETEKIQQAREYEKKITDARLEKQRQVRNIFIVFSALILVVLVFLFRSVRQKQKANKEIIEQKKIIEHKNKDILDSINYSRRIQRAILTPSDEVKKLLPRSFVLFKPKDIVSGDFYFIEPVDASGGKKLIALAMADCTGHGVPGAFMSIMAYNFLKQSLKETSVNTSGQALDYVNKELTTFLRQQKSGGNLRDGMDIAFCVIDNSTNTIDFAGANNPLWVLSVSDRLLMDNGTEVPQIAARNGSYLYEIRATKQHVGYNENIRAFASHRVKLQANDTAILFTDGYADQFGGPSGKKIKSKKFAELILENANVNVELLGEKLEQFFDEWKKNHEQVDDVSVIAYRV
jgi:serine phosphatase RsbU (regulator of sigma subunit)